MESTTAPELSNTEVMRALLARGIFQHDGVVIQDRSHARAALRTAQAAINTWDTAGMTWSGGIRRNVVEKLAEAFCYRELGLANESTNSALDVRTFIELLPDGPTIRVEVEITEDWENNAKMYSLWRSLDFNKKEEGYPLVRAAMKSFNVALARSNPDLRSSRERAQRGPQGRRLRPTQVEMREVLRAAETFFETIIDIYPFTTYSNRDYDGGDDSYEAGFLMGGFRMLETIDYPEEEPAVDLDQTADAYTKVSADEVSDLVGNRNIGKLIKIPLV